MALSGLTIAGISVELLLNNEGFTAGLAKSVNEAAKFERSVNAAFNRITGTKATQQAEILAKAIEKAGGAAKFAGPQLENLRREVESLVRAGAKLPSSLQALQKIGGGNLGQLGANIQTQGLAQLQSQLGPVGGLLSGISGGALAATAGVAALAVGAGAAAKAFGDAAAEFADFAGNLTDLSAQTGIGTTALQELAFVGSFVNTSLEEVASAVGRMQKAIAEGDSVFQRLGLSLQELEGLAPEEQFFKVAEAINAIQDPARRTAAAIEVFGKSGASLLPLFGNLEKLREEAHRLGVVFDEDAIKKGDQLDDAFTRLGASTEALKRSIGSLAANTGFIKFLETFAAGIGAVSANLPGFIEDLNRLGPILAALPGGGAISNIAQLAGLAGAAGGAGAGGADAAAAAALAKRTIAGTQFETQAEEAKRKKIEEQRKRDAEAAAKAAQASADKAAKAWADSAEKARAEWDKFFESMEKAGDDAVSDMLKMAGAEAAAGAERQTQAMLAQLAAVADLGESFREANSKAQELLKTFNLLQSLQGGLGDQTTQGLQEMGEQFAALDQAIPGVAEALAEVNAELAKRGQQPIISDQELKRIEAARRALEELATDLQGLQFILGNVVGLFDALGVSAESGFGRALSGLSDLAGSAAGFFGSLATGDIKGAIGNAISGVTSIVKTIGGLFGKSDAEKAGEIAGRTLGVAISKGLAEAISQTAKDLDIAKEAASLLHLGEAMDESGQSAVSFADEMESLLEGIELGAVPAQEGIEALGDAFTRLADEAEAGSVSAQAAMGALAQQARGLGQSIPEIDEAVRSAVQESTGALGGLGGIKLVDAEDARAQAQIFLNVFNGVLATEGIVAAAQAIKPALDSFREQLSEAGIGKGVADSILAPISGAMSLLKNDMTKGGAEGAQALKTILESQLKAGFLDVNTFTAIQQQAGTAFDQMIQGGANTTAALQAIAPLLAQIQQTAAATGQAIDPVSQGLIDQAKAAGIAFPTDTGQQMVTLLQQMVTLLGGVPETFSQVGSSASSTFGAMQAQAGATSNTIVEAFDGVGAQITDSLAPVGDQLQGQLAGVFQAATAQAQQFTSFLNKIDNTSIVIPIRFDPQGELPGGGGLQLPQFASGTGGVRDFGKETLAALHGREAVIPEADLHTLLRSTAALGASRGGGQGGAPILVRLELDGRVLAETMVHSDRRNTRGAQDQGKRGYR